MGACARLAGAIAALGIGCGGGGFLGGGGANTFGTSATGESATSDTKGSDSDGTRGFEDDGSDDPSASGPDDDSGSGSDSASASSDTGIGPGDELCNGLDDDADGMIDEGFGQLQCGVGACANTAPACEGGVPGQCTPLPASDETCNDIDDDCDGETDEGLTRSCSTACGNGIETCASGTFVGCDAPQPEAETCDATDEDCDGAIDEGVGGCRVGVHRSWHAGSGEHFYTTSLPEAQCCGFTLEVQDFYSIYIDSHPGLVNWMRCIKPNGMHFYTTAGNCEGTTVEGTMGYVATAQIGDSRPLYRSYSNVTGDHFFTTSLAEHNSAVAGGYVDEGVACYVW